MRLIDVKTLELKEFFHNIPPYAILSHTWGSDEVTFQDYLIATDPHPESHAHAIKRRAGFTKIIGACKRAHADGLQYVWCDTNCIDKSSSAELSEAINSMYAWYRDSVVCYAYLADADDTPNSFVESRWFTRGWTLQELLAPSKVIFFNKHWAVLGDRKDLAEIICDVTRIHIGALRDRNTVSKHSIAQRMSWAADRQTSRQEDTAYCLLGIFEVNMPLLYGEGLQAFRRLQHEIIKVSDDQSILVWVLPTSADYRWTSALAPHPTAFKFSGSVVRSLGSGRVPYSVMNLGISMSLPTIRTRNIGIILVGLNCSRELSKKLPIEVKSHGEKNGRCFRIWIPLRHMGDETYMRGHWPMSEIILGRSYPTLAPSRLKSLLLVMDDPSSISPSSMPSVTYGVGSKSALPIPELLITLSSGRMMPQGRTLREAYLLDDVLVTRLGECRKSSSSHYAISSGSLSIILSIYWDEDGQPQEWLHTTIPKPGSQTTRHGYLQEALLSSGDPTYASDADAISALYALHAHLEHRFREAMRVLNQEEYPLVWIRDSDLKDLHGKPVLAVEIIFREPPQIHAEYR
ncbi:HET-domain-containing protein [Xylariaceae sp. AK1471]|nr:HET-domain-containing protein [Xylariaceae sp. AK1471]